MSEYELIDNSPTREPKEKIPILGTEFKDVGRFGIKWPLFSLHYAPRLTPKLV
jgi:hypothetical protein|tara:strand:+ start:159 stop:317 length:159 start_codon:yes stop_codon:yes gene_type:complete